MKLGFAVKVLGQGGLKSHDTRRWQSGPHLSVSLDHLDRILDYLDANDIGMYRMATALAPYASHPDLPQFHHQVEECAERLEEIGKKVRSLGIRLSSHPGQYTVLNSLDARVAELAIDELEVQANLFEAMGLGPENVVVIHVGGGTDDRAAGLDRFEKRFAQLSERAQGRLVIENDDRSYDLSDALQLSGRIERPVVWDILHHHCLDREGIEDREALRLALDSWPKKVMPKVHYSSPRLDMETKKKKVGRRVEHRLVLPPLRAHADLVDPVGFESFLQLSKGLRDFDVMLEAKAKDLALLRLREQMKTRGFEFSN